MRMRARLDQAVARMDDRDRMWAIITFALVILVALYPVSTKGVVELLLALWKKTQVGTSILLLSFLAYSLVRGWVIQPLSSFWLDIIGSEERRRGPRGDYVVDRNAIPLVTAAVIAFGEIALLGIFFPVFPMFGRLLFVVFGSIGLFLTYRFFLGGWVFEIGQQERANLEREGRWWCFLERGWQYVVPFLEDIPTDPAHSRIVNLARETWDTKNFDVMLGDGSHIDLDIQLLFLVPDLEIRGEGEEPALPTEQTVYRFVYGYKVEGAGEDEEDGELLETFRKTAQAVAREFAAETRADPLSDDLGHEWISRNQTELSGRIRGALSEELDGQPSVLEGGGITLLEVRVKSINFGNLAGHMQEREAERIKIGTEEHRGEQATARIKAMEQIAGGRPQAVELDMFYRRQTTMTSIATGPNNTVLGVDVDKVELDLRGGHSGSGPANAGQGGQQPAQPTQPPSGGSQQGGANPPAGGGSRGGGR